jgi:chlorite dismutase
VQPEWRRLEADRKAAGRRELTAVIDELSDGMMIHSYSLMGTRGDADFMLWMAAERLEQIQGLATRMFSTDLGRHLDTTHSYLAMTKKSMYIDKHRHANQERLTVTPLGRKYLFVYPFVKTRAWYTLDIESRQEMMRSHFVVGHKYPDITINTSYSFGLDDQEFVVSFEGDDPGNFLDLVMELRLSKASSYTERDTPILTGVSMSMEEALESLGD